MVRMDQRVTFQGRTGAPDGGGGVTNTWGNIATNPVVWASVKPSRGGEGLDEDRTNARASYMFTIRNRTDLDETMRIVWQSENYNIRAILREGPRPLYVTIDTERGAADVT